MLELIFQGFMEWAYGLALECWEYFSSSLLDIMSMDYAYMKSHVPVMVSIAQVLLAVGWALLIGNLVFQALKSMAVGLGFEGEDPKLLFTRTFVFAFLLMASPQICEVGLSLTARIIELLEIPDAINVTLVDEGMFGSLGAAWLLAIIFGLIIMLKVFRLLLEIAERYVILAVLTMTAPLAFAMGGSKSTSEIFGGWCRMFGSMCTLMVTNVIFFKMLLSVLSNVPSGLDIIPWIVLILTIVKVARKADAIISETFRNVPLLLSHVCLCAVRFDGYILAMVSVLILMLTIPAYAVQSRAPAVLPSLSFSGTKATCEVLVTADNYMDDIYLEIELWRGSVKIEDWTVSGEGFIDFSKTASVAKGNTYTLKVYAEINNVEITPVSLTKTYR